MIPQDVLERVLAKAQESASHSWEYSTVFEALLEYRSPQYSVFHPDAFPDGEIPRLKIEGIDALRYVTPHIRTDSATLSEGNGSAADPASLCLPTLLLSRSPSLQEETRNAYHTALSRQLDTLLARTPRFPNGAISHREAYPSLWADFIYMVPPILAYHAVSTHDLSMARQSVHQCHLYHDVLSTPTGLWQHIANSPTAARNKTDAGAWCTSNAWAAAGMSRVLATLRNSPFAAHTAPEQASLLGMTKAILDAAMRVDTHPSRLLRNYLDDDMAFADVAGTALMAAAAFRIALLLRPDDDDDVAERYTAWASAKMQAVVCHVDPDTGIARPVVNSLKESQEMPLGGVNPEAQAFIVLMYAAWRDWRLAVEKGH